MIDWIPILEDVPWEAAEEARNAVRQAGVESSSVRIIEGSKEPLYTVAVEDLGGNYHIAQGALR